MQLARFLNTVFKKDGFILEDAYSKNYIIGSPEGDKPIKVKILDKKLHYKLLLHPDLYFGEAYTDGSIIIENGSLSDFLDLALMNFGRNELNFFSYLINRLRGSYRYLTNFNFIKKSKMNVSHHYDISDDLYDLFTSSFVIFSDGLRFNILYASVVVIVLTLDTLLLLNENLPEFLRV